MTKPTRHTPGWLKHVFSTVAAVTLSFGASQAFANEDAPTPDTLELDATQITQMAETAQTAMPGLVKQACADTDILLVGDTDHTSLAVHRSMSGNDTLDALAECGVSTVFVELSTAFQDRLDNFFSGAIGMDELRSEYLQFVSDMHNMDPADYEAKREASLAMFAHAKELGMHVVAADPQNGAVEGLMISMMVHGAFDMIKRGLPDEYKPYHDLFLDGRDDEIPEEHRDAFAAAFAELYESEEVQGLFDKADAMKEDAMNKRTDDTALADVITGHVEPGDRAVVMYGAGHFSNTRDVGLDAILAERGYKTSRLDVYESAEKISYEKGDDLPRHIFMADSDTVLTLNSRPADKPAPAASPGKAAKIEM